MAGFGVSTGGNAEEEIVNYAETCSFLRASRLVQISPFAVYRTQLCSRHAQRSLTEMSSARSAEEEI
ncbi:hypothetical protein [Halovenus halobia]|uniref:hypothetical protein n=1 Tax=Halovenus halobia TaxID=3396622 RepID=UPI003F573A4F